MLSRKEPRALPELPDRLHSVAIHLLRRLRSEDELAGISGPRLSALSVLVFRGSMTLGELARAEQVRPPSMTRIVRELERSGLVRSMPHPQDGRSTVVGATRKGIGIVQEGRTRRVRLLQGLLDGLSERDRRTLARAVEILDGVLARK